MWRRITSQDIPGRRDYLALGLGRQIDHACAGGQLLPETGSLVCPTCGLWESHLLDDSGCSATNSKVVRAPTNLAEDLLYLQASRLQLSNLTAHYRHRLLLASAARSLGKIHVNHLCHAPLSIDTRTGPKPS